MLRQAELGSSSGSNNNNNNSRGQSIVKDHGVYTTTCCYCKSESETSIAHRLSADPLTVDDYQDLLDRGWSSGGFLYKPEMERTCCTPYTIRLKVDSFVPSKEQTRVYRRMQRTVGKHEHLERHSLEICTKRSSFDPEEFALYKKYQIRVHNNSPEQVEESSYKQFLVDTPLIFVPPTNDNTVPSCGFGSFHQQYLIDGKLVAVGVVDRLPRCLSSKYLFWDPDLAFISLGKYSALQEIKWVQEAQKHCPSLQYYYLGYYIHSCPKMRYKAAYSPSELLCPLCYQSVSFDLAKPLLDKKSYVCLSDYHHA